jgi:hypothetical protein
MRGPCYIWRDDTQVQVWAENGSDGWGGASWADGIKGSLRRLKNDNEPA